MPTEFPSDLTFNGIRDLQDYCHQSASDRGFHESTQRVNHAFYTASPGDPNEQEIAEDYRNLLGNRLLLVVSEIIEAQDEIRKGNTARKRYYDDGKPEGFPSELADAVIRLLDLAGEHSIDLADVIKEKLIYNAQRSFRHGKAF